ncbi:MAG: DegT/DnrJ/EryC1/StrS family aminotransferase [Candidatus Sumerlaeia bacterium]|nr:DegT/DnrJ/EryC1/StrS family aminotransferase [Candidatus Sumerlaeia bacterium]
MTPRDPIPFLDLAAQTDEVRAELNAALAAVLEHGRYIKGPEVGEFECAFSQYCGVPYCVGASNGTSALHAALHCLGVGPCDEVIVPSHTFIATVESVLLAGARPVFADIRRDTMLLDAGAAAAAITEHTAAIVGVHLYGLPVDADRLGSLCATEELLFVEDAAQAHGARWRGRRTGGLGAAAAWSFFPGKNLGALGDAGGVTMRDPALHERVRRYVDHGRDTKFTHSEIGTNYRLDTLQAALLSVKLRRLDAWNARRRELAAHYRAILSQEPFRSVPVRLQEVPAEAEHAYHLFVVRVRDRDHVREEMLKRGVETGLHYPVPCHLQPALEHLGYGHGSLPETEAAAAEILSLPMFPHMTNAQVERVCDALRQSLQTGVPPA